MERRWRSVASPLFLHLFLVAFLTTFITLHFVPAVEPSHQVVSFAEDLLSAAAALETQAEALDEDAKETQSLNEHALNLEEKMDNLRLDAKAEE